MALAEDWTVLVKTLAGFDAGVWEYTGDLARKGFDDGIMLLNIFGVDGSTCGVFSGSMPGTSNEVNIGLKLDGLSTRHEETVSGEDAGLLILSGQTGEELSGFSGLRGLNWAGLLLVCSS